jgi:thiol-disulfide isomerase/thioredoxin
MFKFAYVIFVVVALIACKDKPLQDLTIDELNSHIDQVENLLDSLQNIRSYKVAQDTTGKYSALAFSQIEEVFVSPNTATLKLKVDTTLQLSKIELVKNKPYQADFAKSIKLNNEGTGLLDVEIGGQSFYELKIGNRTLPIYLKAGKTIGVIVDSIDEKGIVFIGDLSKENQWLQNQTNESLAIIPDSILISNEDADEYSALVTQNILSTLDDSFDSEFRQLIAKKENCQANRRLINYYTDLDNLSVDSAFVVDELLLNDTELFGLYEYRKFIFEYFEQQANSELSNIAIAKTDGKLIDYYHNKYGLVDELFDNEQIANFLKTDVIFEAITQLGNISVNPLVRHFQNEVNYKPFQKTINAKYKSTIAPQKGALAPSISGVTFSGEEFNLEDYRGQYVYIFTWATWCGPCKVELPYYERMIEDYENENIMFVGISVDKDKKKWTESFFYDNYPGLQVIVPGDWKSPFVKDYNMTSIPQFILINPDGEIEELNAERPTKYVKAQLSQYGIYPRAL